MNQYMKATSNKAWKKNQPHLGKSGQSGFMVIFFSPIWANLEKSGFMDNFFQPHLGKSGFRAKKIQHYLGGIYYLFWEKFSIIQGALINRRSTLQWIFPLNMVIFHSYVSLPEGTCMVPYGAGLMKIQGPFDLGPPSSTGQLKATRWVGFLCHP